MKTSIAIPLLFSVLFALPAAAKSPRGLELRSRAPLMGGPADPAKSPGDSTLIIGPWGSGALFNGQFQSPEGLADWNGWTGRDYTHSLVNHWHADTYHAVAGQYSAWCGDSVYSACDAMDEAGGYGNGWNDALEWRGQVADPGLSCTVDISALINHDLEPGYDQFSVQIVLGDGTKTRLGWWDGAGTDVPIASTFTYLPGEFAGAGGDEVVVRFLVETDGSYSDQDCNFPTIGAVQLDDVAITLSNGSGVSWDFEDGTLGPFANADLPGVGNFAKIWTGLMDSDPCRYDFSPQVAFIDDGEVVPGTGGSLCIDHCYGPNGFVVNSTGGLSGPNMHLDNGIVSPVIPWPAGMEGTLLEFTVFEDDYLFQLNDDPGILYTWYVRSTSNPDPAMLEASAWRNLGFIYLNESIDGRYFRRSFVIGHLLEPGAKYVQVTLNAVEFGFKYGQNGNNATPAPYFDDVRVTAYEPAGPTLTAPYSNLAMDAFPASGAVDMANPGAMSARFDGSYDLSGRAAVDSVLVDVVSARSGAALTGPPELYYRLLANPVFDLYRTSGLPLIGSVPGLLANSGNSADRYAFDLPDSNFLFPGDVLRYCITATDDAGGVLQTSILPADTTGFSSPDKGLVYDPDFTVRVLPTITEDPGNPGSYLRPDLLVWNDAGASREYDTWATTLAQLGLVMGVDYDLVTRPGGDTSMEARVSPVQLASYDDLIYLSGSDFSGIMPDEDILLLDGWFATGGKDLLGIGTALAGQFHDIYGWGGSGIGPAFALARLGIASADRSYIPLIEDQDFPRVLPLAGNPVLGPGISNWRDNARCLPDGSRLPNFVPGNAVTPTADAVVLAEYAAPNGTAGAYPYAAGLLKVVPADSSRAVILPTTLRRIYPDPDAAKATAPLSPRTAIIRDILAYFGRTFTGEVSGVPGVAALAVDAYPNPFNPTTSLSYTLPRDGHLSLKVFDLRGRLVRTLVDEQREAGAGRVVWDGLDEGGARASSGVYFFKARSGDQVKVGKITMIK